MLMSLTQTNLLKNIDNKIFPLVLIYHLPFTTLHQSRWTSEMLATIERIEAEIDKISLPLIIVQGAKDTLIEPAGAQMVYDQASSADKTLKIYPEMFHEVFNEPDRDLALKDVEDWLEKQLN